MSGIHVRQQILVAVVADGVLLNLPTTGTAVYKSRSLPQDAVQGENIRALKVRMGKEQRGPWPEEMGYPRLQPMAAHLEVVAVVTDADEQDEVLDQILLEVRAALAAAKEPGGPLAGLVKDLIYEGFEIDEDDVEGLGDASRVYVFSVIYVTAENAPDVAT